MNSGRVLGAHRWNVGRDRGRRQCLTLVPAQDFDDVEQRNEVPEWDGSEVCIYRPREMRARGRSIVFGSPQALNRSW
jgi:hypothetical protein